MTLLIMRLKEKQVSIYYVKHLHKPQEKMNRFCLNLVCSKDVHDWYRPWDGFHGEKTCHSNHSSTSILKFSNPVPFVSFWTLLCLKSKVVKVKITWCLCGFSTVLQNIASAILWELYRSATLTGSCHQNGRRIHLQQLRSKEVQLQKIQEIR